MALDKNLLRRLLQIEEPWSVHDYRLEPRSKRCDVWIAFEVGRGWFGLPKKTFAGNESTWRHIPFGNLQIHVHVAVPERADVSKLDWIGEEGLPFTRAMARQVFALFNEGVSLRGICSVLDIPLNDLWRYRMALENGKIRLTQAQPSKTPGTQAEIPAPQAAQAAMAQEATGDSKVPELADPIWERIITGERPLDVRVLSLKLLLTRLRSQFEIITDDEVRMLKLGELHRYFVKHERLLGQELSQMH